MSTRATALVLALVATASLVACGADEPEPTRESLLAAWTVAGAEPSDLQEQIIADGTITEAEYLSVVDAAAQCMADRGWQVSDPEPRLDGLTYAFTTGSDGGGSAEDQDARASQNTSDFTECAAGTIDPLEMAYFDANLYTGEERQQAYADLGACLESAGVAADVDTKTRTEISAILQQESASDAAYLCLEKAARLFPSLPDQ